MDWKELFRWRRKDLWNLLLFAVTLVGILFVAGIVAGIIQWRGMVSILSPFFLLILGLYFVIRAPLWVLFGSAYVPHRTMVGITYLIVLLVVYFQFKIIDYLTIKGTIKKERTAWMLKGVLCIILWLILLAAVLSMVDVTGARY